jgi:hypothetical protein
MRFRKPRGSSRAAASDPCVMYCMATCRKMGPIEPTCGPLAAKNRCRIFSAANLLTRQTWLHRNGLGRPRPSPTPPKLIVIGHSMFRVLLLPLCCATSTVVRANSCPGNPDTLGTPFLRLLDRLNSRGTAISAPTSGRTAGTRARIAVGDGDIVHFQGTRSAMLPAPLKALKDKRYRVVHIAPAMAQWPPLPSGKSLSFLRKRTANDGKAQ